MTTMNHSKIKSLINDVTLAFGNNATIPISELGAVFAMVNLPSKYQSVRISLQSQYKKDSLTLDNLFCPLLVKNPFCKILLQNSSANIAISTPPVSANLTTVQIVGHATPLFVHLPVNSANTKDIDLYFIVQDLVPVRRMQTMESQKPHYLEQEYLMLILVPQIIS
jgi:hypothetical protein